MSSLNYWRQLAMLAEKRPMEPDPSWAPALVGSWARDYAQKGISLIIMGDDKRARLFIEKARQLAKVKTGVYRESKELVWIYLLDMLLETEPDRSCLERALEANYDEILGKLKRMGSGDILEHLLKLDFSKKNSPPVNSQSLAAMSPEPADSYSYRVAAYDFVEFARRALLISNFELARDCALSARELCKRAVQQIPQDLVRDNPRWKKLNENLANISRLSETEKNKYLEERKKLSGPIQPILQMADIIQLIGSTANVSGVLSGNMSAEITMGTTDFFTAPEKILDKLKGVIFYNPSLGYKMGTSSGSGFSRLFEAFLDTLRSTLASMDKGRPLDLLEDFFETSVNPPDAECSSRGLLETMEWLIIRMRLDIIARGSLVGRPLKYFVRKYLGGREDP